MRYDPRLPHEFRYVRNGPPVEPSLYERVVGDCLKICRALGYDMNTVEFACQDGIPYAIDFLNPAPDADYHSVGPENFEWMLNAMAEFSIAEAQKGLRLPVEMKWSTFLNPGVTSAAAV
jgi:hypothetical protein